MPCAQHSREVALSSSSPPLVLSFGLLPGLFCVQTNRQLPEGRKHAFGSDFHTLHSADGELVSLGLYFLQSVQCGKSVLPPLAWSDHAWVGILS